VLENLSATTVPMHWWSSARSLMTKRSPRLPPITSRCSRLLRPSSHKRRTEAI
jgi:hypothetical protein